MSRIVRFRLDFTSVCSIGPGKVALLEGIERTGSLTQAARVLRMSYRRAWLLLDDLNHSFSEPVVTATAGGQGGGGAVLTPFGLEIVKTYRSASRSIEEAVAPQLERIAMKALARRSQSAGVRRQPLARTSRSTRTPSSRRSRRS